MDENRYVSRIVLTPRSQNASPVTWNTERQFEEIRWASSDFPDRYLSGPPIGSLTDIRLEDWEVRFETDYRDDFKKVASVVGKKKAAKVLRALNGAVPANWEGK